MKYKVSSRFLFWGGALMSGIGFLNGLQAGGAIAIAFPPAVFVLAGVATAIWGFVSSNATPVDPDALVA